MLRGVVEMPLAETSGEQWEMYNISGGSLLPVWGRISNRQTCLSLFIVAEGIFAAGWRFWFLF